MAALSVSQEGSLGLAAPQTPPPDGWTWSTQTPCQLHLQCMCEFWSMQFYKVQYLCATKVFVHTLQKKIDTILWFGPLFLCRIQKNISNPQYCLFWLLKWKSEALLSSKLWSVLVQSALLPTALIYFLDSQVPCQWWLRRGVGCFNRLEVIPALQPENSFSPHPRFLHPQHFSSRQLKSLQKIEFLLLLFASSSSMPRFLPSRQREGAVGADGSELTWHEGQRCTEGVEGLE